MLPDEWRSVRRILAVYLGSVDELRLLSPALQRVKQTLPEVSIALLCPKASQTALLMPAVDELLHSALTEHEAVSCEPHSVLSLIATLRSQSFDAAILFPQESLSPYPLAYACYLAEIPIRAGVSQEFGGGVLSHWVKDVSAESKGDRNLLLLQSIGLLPAENCSDSRGQKSIGREI